MQRHELPASHAHQGRGTRHLKLVGSSLLATLLLSVICAPPSRADRSAKRPGGTAETASAADLLDAVDDTYRGSHSIARLEMKVQTEHWARSLEMKAWSHGKQRSLVRILSPRKEKGTATLRVDGDIWNFLPRVKRVIKLPSSMMGGSWMGSHFTNDDLVKNSRLREDYTFRIVASSPVEGDTVVDIECLPRENAVVVWGKVVVRVRAGDRMPVQMKYFDEDLKLARTMDFLDVKQFGSRKLPATMKVTPADSPKEYTLVRYLELDFDSQVPDSTFSLRSLSR